MAVFNKSLNFEHALTIGTDAYTANDVVGGLQSISVHNGGGGGILQTLRVVDDDGEGAALTVYFFNAAPTTIADDAAFAPAIADLKKMVDYVTITAGDYTTLNGNDIAIKNNINMQFVAPTLYYYVVCTGTPTYAAATDLTINGVVWLDA